MNGRSEESPREHVASDPARVRLPRRKVGLQSRVYVPAWHGRRVGARAISTRKCAFEHTGRRKGERYHGLLMRRLRGPRHSRRVKGFAWLMPRQRRNPDGCRTRASLLSVICVPDVADGETSATSSTDIPSITYAYSVPRSAPARRPLCLRRSSCASVFGTS